MAADTTHTASPGRVDARALEAGLDALETAVVAPRRSAWSTAWSAFWPTALALGVFVAVWQLVYLAGVKPEYALPGPADVATTFVGILQDGTALKASALSLQRGGLGFVVSVVVGVVLGIAMATIPLLRRAIGPMITGLQSLPSIAWVPAAVIWFGLSNTTIFAVVLLGAVPSIVNGLLTGVDQVPPLFLRVGRVLGARGWDRIRFVLLPAALPGFLGGLKQGWAFAWRSLMAAELITNAPRLGTGLGQVLDLGRTLSDMSLVIAAIFLIFAVGIAIELLVFAPLERRVLHARGLTGLAGQ
ncbi:ABC transporter permease [Cellulomonas cellasea]|uniref:Sulfate ABC transporter permease n=2 Tax=Cellulomonas cellasea TaxID=43670 RepID=A0A0A0B8K2_9CELL|nr:ABC transporter permease [Cellulomonas cellasea]KGM02154.1 sulfate ABC transporter permease [Cellulomonas cellasea DSM 20118]GEA88660.1 sulfate ABC transporter permease [Cellulomonas cellasea]